MRVYVESMLDCVPEKVWAKVQTSALLLEVIHPLVRVVPVDSTSFPERWEQGTTTRWKTFLLGFIPLGTHTVFIERIDSAAREIQSRERDRLISKWDHLIRVRQTADGRSLYSDEIDINAGFLTWLVWLFAIWFYRHRQRKWRGIAKRLART